MWSSLISSFKNTLKNKKLPCQGGVKSKVKFHTNKYTYCYVNMAQIDKGWSQITQNTIFFIATSPIWRFLLDWVPFGWQWCFQQVLGITLPNISSYWNKLLFIRSEWCAVANINLNKFWWGKYLKNFQGQIQMENGGSVGFLGLRSTFESLFCMQNHYQPPLSLARYKCSLN